MKNVLGVSVVFICALFMSACAGILEQNTAQREESFPLNRDDAAVFLASNQKEVWLPLQRNAGGGDKFSINADRVMRYADGISGVWTKMEFGQAAYSPEVSEPIVATLMYMQVRCEDSTYRSDAWYALGKEGQILDVLTYDLVEFIPLGADSAASKVYQLACIGSDK